MRKKNFDFSSLFSFDFVCSIMFVRLRTEIFLGFVRFEDPWTRDILYYNRFFVVAYYNGILSTSTRVYNAFRIADFNIVVLSSFDLSLCTYVCVHCAIIYLWIDLQLLCSFQLKSFFNFRCVFAIWTVKRYSSIRFTCSPYYPTTDATATATYPS